MKQLVNQKMISRDVVKIIHIAEKRFFPVLKQRIEGLPEYQVVENRRLNIE